MKNKLLWVLGALSSITIIYLWLQSMGEPNLCMVDLQGNVIHSGKIGSYYWAKMDKLHFGIYRISYYYVGCFHLIGENNLVGSELVSTLGYKIIIDEFKPFNTSISIIKELILSRN